MNTFFRYGELQFNSRPTHTGHTQHKTISSDRAVKMSLKESSKGEILKESVSDATDPSHEVNLHNY